MATPSIAYSDPRRGIRWLTDVLGLRQKSLYETPDGQVALQFDLRDPEGNLWTVGTFQF